MINRRLEFGWTDSPGCFCLLTSAWEHAHAATSVADAVVTEQGRAAATHIEVAPPTTPGQPSTFPPGCVLSRESGGRRNDSFFIGFYVDDGIRVEIQWFPNGDRCKRASESCASDHFRLLGERGEKTPPQALPVDN